MNNKIKKSTAKEVFMPVDISIRYKRYCQLTKLNYTEHLRILILNSLIKLKQTEELQAIVEKTKNRDFYEETIRYSIRLPEDSIVVLNHYCKTFQIYGSRCYFLYYLIEKDLLKILEDTESFCFGAVNE